MVIVESGGHRFYMDGYHKSNLDALKKNVKKNYDAFILYVSREGFGKTTKSCQDAVYCDPTFNLDRVVFTIEQFLEAVKNAEKYQAIVFDETMGYLSNRQTMGKFNRALIKIMSEMRSKNLFVFLNIPNFFMMDWYVGLHRTTGLVYIYKRGHFGSYDYPTKKLLWLKGKKYHSYSVSPNFIGRFVKYFPLDWDAYEKKKQQAISEWDNVKITEIKLREQRDALMKDSFEKKYYDLKQLSALLKLNERHVRRIVT